MSSQELAPNHFPETHLEVADQSQPANIEVVAGQLPPRIHEQVQEARVKALQTASKAGELAMRHTDIEKAQNDALRRMGQY